MDSNIGYVSSAHSSHHNINVQLDYEINILYNVFMKELALISIFLRCLYFHYFS